MRWLMRLWRRLRGGGAVEEDGRGCFEKERVSGSGEVKE